MPKENDWTNKTLVLDIVNSLGETYHFEIEPGEKDDLPTRPSARPDNKSDRATLVEIQLPLL